MKTQVATAPASFNFEGCNIRTVSVDGQNVWIAKDLCNALGMTWKGAQGLSHVPAEWRGVTPVVTPSGIQQMICLTQEGMYFFLNRSDMPKAIPIQKWIAGTVLPQISATGMYIDPGHPAAQTPHADNGTQLGSLQVQLLAAQNMAIDAQAKTIAAQAQTIELLSKPSVNPGTGPKGRVSDAEVKQMRELYLEGWSWNQIAKEMQRSNRSVGRAIQGVNRPAQAAV